MLPLFAALTLAAATLVPSSASALSLNVTGGLSMPTGTFGEDAKSGFTLGAGLFHDVNDMLAFGIEGSWHRAEHEAVGTIIEVDPGVFFTLDQDRFSVLQFGPALRVTLAGAGSPVRPYFLAGVGIYNIQEDYAYTVDDGATIERFTNEDDEADGLFEQIGTRFGAKLGVGALFQAGGRVGFGVDASWHIVTLDEDDVLTPLSGESSLQFFGIQGALVFDLSPGY
jgi:hypothetical protein